MIRCVVPFHNCEPWLQRCLDSILAQRGDYWLCDVIDDASTDDSARIYEPYFKASIGMIKVQRNFKNMGAGYNLYHTIMNADPTDIIVIVDGDDFLPHGLVFQRIEALYKDPDLWMLWTQYEPKPYHTTLVDNRPVKVDPTITNRTQLPSATYTEEEARTPGFFRYHPIRINHLVTFRAALFHKAVTAQDLQLENGEWCKAGYDRMIFTPLLECAGWDHIRFVDEVLYCYNSMNPNSDVSVRREEGDAAHARVARIPFKEPLNDLL